MANAVGIVFLRGQVGSVFESIPSFTDAMIPRVGARLALSTCEGFSELPVLDRYIKSLGSGMHVGHNESNRLCEELAFVCFELDNLKAELDGWEQVDFSRYLDRTRGVWRRERVRQSVVAYSERKKALVAAIQAQIS